MAASVDGDARANRSAGLASSATTSPWPQPSAALLDAISGQRIGGTSHAADAPPDEVGKQENRAKAVLATATNDEAGVASMNEALGVGEAAARERPPQAADFAAVLDASPDCYLLLTPELTVAYANAAQLASVDRRARDVLGLRLFDVLPAAVGGDEIDLLRHSIERVRDERRPDEITLPRHGPSSDAAAEHRWCMTHTPILDADGELRYILQHAREATSARRKRDRPDSRAAAGAPNRADAVLSRQYKRLLALFRQAPGFMCVLEGQALIVRMANAGFEASLGRRDYRDRPLGELLPELESQGYLDVARRVFLTGEAFQGRGMPVRLNTAEGTTRLHYLDILMQPVHQDDDHRKPIVGLAISGYDVSPYWEARRDLARHRDRLEDLVRERREIDAVRNTNQRLEAIGQLTGGVAHDFNNVLQIIRSNLQLLEDRVADDTSADRYLAVAQEGVERGARLAAQLLAFARRQQLDPIVLDLGERLSQLTGLLDSAVGAGVEIATTAAPDLWNVRVDPSGLENVLLNLAINARDAMAGRGRLTIEAGNVELDECYVRAHGETAPGRYVMLAVADTGCGMSEDVRRRACEPFFTTKPAPQGSGLGLSMAHGFMRQSGGLLDLDSEIGVGTIIKLYFPYSDEPATQVEQEAESPPGNGHETILLVEDEAAVRNAAVELLRGFGYRVLAAADAVQALAILREDTPIDLLFSDVVMPGPVCSDELAAEARRLQPDIAVLFTSGYPERAIRRAGHFEPPVKLLQKPYRREELARMVRQVLHRRALKRGAAVVAREGASSTPVRVLLVEDNEILRSTTAEYLREIGYEVEGCANGSEALARADEARFDVLMTDIDLPGMSGLELVNTLRRAQPAVGAVIVSGYVHLLGDNVPPDTLVLAKPFDMSTLDRLLRKASARRA